jgi:Chalcone isomerase-like
MEGGSRMVPSRMLAVVLVGAWGAGGLATELVGVRGSFAQFATRIESTIGSTPVTLVLTGGALRQKAVFNIYAIASYVQEGRAVRSAGELAATDCPKQLHLVMERDVTGEQMTAAFTTAIRMGHPAPAFAPELDELAGLLRGRTIRTGDHIWLTHVPGVGLHCQVVGRGEHLIKNVRFSRAVWDVYLGEKNLGESIKQGLVSRLERDGRPPTASRSGRRDRVEE